MGLLGFDFGSTIAATSSQLRLSIANISNIEEDSLVSFYIGLTESDVGLVASANIDITAISAILSVSTGGGAFTSVGVTQPTFGKANGKVYVDYQFLAAEWAVGDGYKLEVSGISCTVDGNTVYIEPVQWSGSIIDETVLHTKIDNIQTDIGDLSSRTNLQNLEDMLGNPDTAGKTVYEAVKNIRETAIDGSSIPIANTLSDILHKDGSYTYDNTTDSLEAVSDKITALNNISTAQVNTEVDAALNTIVPASPTAGSVNDILSKAAGANTFDKSTDSLEALRDRIDTLNTADQADLDDILLDTGTTLPATLTGIENKIDTVDTVVDGIQTDLSNATDGLGALKTLIDTAISDIGTVDTVVDGIQTDLDNATDGLGALKSLIDTVDAVVDNIEDYVDGTTATPTAYRREIGVTQFFTKNITAAANAGSTTVATITSQACMVKSIVLRSNGATTADLTSAAVKGGTSAAFVFISSDTAAQASIDATDKQVSWTGSATLDSTKTIIIDLQGTDVTAVDLDVDIEYFACFDGGYLV